MVDELGHHVAGRVDDIGVVPAPAHHRVVARTAVEDVGTGIAGQRVVELIARAVDGPGPRQGEVLDFVPQRVADAALDEVGSLSIEFRHDIACRIDHVGVVAGSAQHGVVASAAAQGVGAAIAGQRVVERVAGRIDIAGPRQREVFHVGAGREGDAALNRIGPLARLLCHHIPGRIDHVGVVTGSAQHGVAAGATVEDVVAGVAGQRVGASIAGAVDVARPRQGQVLDIGAQRVADAALHRIGARAGTLRHHVARCIDHIRVIAGAAQHRVVARAAVESVVAAAAAQHVVARVADQRIVECIAGSVDVAGPCQDQVLDVGAQRVADAALDRIGALTRELRNRIAGRIDDVGVITLAAEQFVIARPAVQGVVAGQAGDHILFRCTDQGVVPRRPHDRAGLVVDGDADHFAVAEPIGIGHHHGDVVRRGRLVVEIGACLHSHLVADHLKGSGGIGGQHITERIGRIRVDRPQGRHHRSGRGILLHRAAHDRDIGRRVVGDHRRNAGRFADRHRILARRRDAAAGDFGAGDRHGNRWNGANLEA